VEQKNQVSRGQFFKAKSAPTRKARAYGKVGAYRKVGAYGKVGALQLPRRELTLTQVLKNCPQGPRLFLSHLLVMEKLGTWGPMSN
jgi:hypothetical protein